MPVAVSTKSRSTAGTQLSRSLILLMVFAFITIFALAGCASAQQQQRQQDIKTCAKLGLPYGSQDNFLCVLRQQRQRNS